MWQTWRWLEKIHEWQLFPPKIKLSFVNQFFSFKTVFLGVPSSLTGTFKYYSRWAKREQKSSPHQPRDEQCCHQSIPHATSNIPVWCSGCRKLSAISFDWNEQKNRSAFRKAFKPESKFNTYVASENSPDASIRLQPKPLVVIFNCLSFWNKSIHTTLLESG